MELDKIPLWRGDHVSIKQLIDDFARYLYLPRLSGPAVILESVRSGLSSLTWERDAFAYADSYDQAAERYRGLAHGPQVRVDESGVVVKAEVARRQIDAEIVKSEANQLTPTHVSR